MDLNKKITMTIPAEAEYVDLVRFTIYGIANKIGFSYEDIEDLKVAVSEACNNAVLHAYNEEEKGEVEISFEFGEQGLRISVKDFGTSFDAKSSMINSAPILEKELSDITAGGLGLYLMQSLVDEVDVKTDFGTEVVLMKYYNRSELPS